MSISHEFCDNRKCTKDDEYLLKILDDKITSPKKFLLTDNDTIYNKISKNTKGKYPKSYVFKSLKKYKKELIDEIESVLDLTKTDDNTILKIEERNKVKKYTILDKKLYFISGAHKVYGSKVYDLYSKLIRHVYENQNFDTKIEFTDKQKIMARCAREAYHFSKNNPRYRPESIIDPKYKTVYEYIDGLSDIGTAIWCNDQKNIFNNKVVIISYKGTGLEQKKNSFSMSGNYQRDFLLDLKIVKGKISKSKEMKAIIKNFDKIYKLYGKEYDFYVTGHSLGGRLAYEVYRARYKKIKQCHMFNAGFGLDIGYLNDIIKSKKRDLYNYHIGGKSIYPTDDDFVSILAGGYGKSSTFYKNFNKGLKGHGILNFSK